MALWEGFEPPRGEPHRLSARPETRLEAGALRLGDQSSVVEYVEEGSIEKFAAL